MGDVEYRVVWKRDGIRRKVRRFANRLPSAERFLNFLTSDEPWRFMHGEPSPDGYVCCSGRECGCYGETLREHCANIRAQIPGLEYAHIERRNVEPWATVPRNEDGSE